MWRPDQLVAHTSGAHGVAVLDAGLGPRRPRHGAAPGHDLRRASRGPRPAERDGLRRHGARRVAPGRRSRSSSRSAASRYGCPNRPGRSTTRRWPWARITWSPWSTTRSTCCRAPESIVRPSCSRRCCRPRSTTRCDSATRALTGPVSRGDAATVAAHLDSLRDRAPEQLPAYIAMARRTAERALAAGRITDAQAAAIVDVLDAPMTTACIRARDFAAARGALAGSVGARADDGRAARRARGAARRRARRERRRSSRPSSSTRCSSARRRTWPATRARSTPTCSCAAAAGVDLVWAPAVDDVYRGRRSRGDRRARPAGRPARGRRAARPLRRRAHRRREVAQPRPSRPARTSARRTTSS